MQLHVVRISFYIELLELNLYISRRGGTRTLHTSEILSLPAIPISLHAQAHSYLQIIMTNLKKKLLQHKPYSCEICNLDSWQGSKLTLEIDHKDGDNSNNCIGNLRFLCPNCHSQTTTWRGRNIKRNTVSDEDLKAAILTTDNIRQALIKVGLTPKGANYSRAGRMLDKVVKPIDTSNSQFGSIWINNGVINKKIKSDMYDEYCEHGWKRGRLNVKSPRNHTGRKIITNGIATKFIDGDETTPNGWWRGMAPR